MYHIIPINNANFKQIFFRVAQFAFFIILVTFYSISHADNTNFKINEGLNGSWYDPITSGQGVLIDVNVELEFMFIGWFTYNNQNNPQSNDPNNHRWFSASGNFSGNQAQLNLYESLGGKFDDSTPALTEIIGTITIVFNSCNEAELRYDLENELLVDVIDLVRLTPDELCQTFGVSSLDSKLKNTAASSSTKSINSGKINTGVNGAWYEPSTSGQGMLIDVIPTTNSFFAGWFTYDENSLNGQRWYTLNGSFDNSLATVEIYETSHGLFNQATEVVVTKVGNAQLEFLNCQQAQFDYQFYSGITGTIVLKQLLSDHLCDILQTETVDIPGETSNEELIAFYDVSVATMVNEEILSHQTVLIENGVIQKIDHFSKILIPSEAVIIDGANKYLGPGLTEMHMHIGVGGFSNAKEAGLLLIANGVTTVLSMGDRLNDFSPAFGFVTVPKLGDLFESGDILGPSLIAGNVAYGGTVGDGDRLTIANVSEAIGYANNLKASGYEYIKEYWYLTPEVLSQFEVESVKHNLPIIGHIPRTRPMEESLSKGHKMAAHIQEPYVTYMNSNMDLSLIEPTSQILFNNGTFLTPTLAVFDSFIRVYGTNIEQYNALISREGNQYVSPLIKSFWLTYYNNSFNQSSTAEPGGFDPLYHFFEEMTVSYFEAGVPLLIGTDAPGFPGVMPGFGAHVEMELLSGLGIPPYEVYKAATKNAGQFVDETLIPDVGFGTLEEGKRADLILLDSDPFESIDNLKRPFAVMARGRLWSQTFLQFKLDMLVSKYSNNKIHHLNIPQSINSSLMFCVDHLNELTINGEALDIQ